MTHGGEDVRPPSYTDLNSETTYYRKRDPVSIPTDFTETATVTCDRVALTVGTYSTDRGQRRYWHAYITVEGDVAYETDDLSGYGSADDALDTFGSFLSAWAESVDYAERTGRTGENADLFPLPLYHRISNEIEDLAALASERVEANV